jgi:hypothetical protein
MFTRKWIVGLIVGLALFAFAFTQTAVASIEVVWSLEISGPTSMSDYHYLDEWPWSQSESLNAAAAGWVTLRRDVITSSPSALWPTLPTSADVSISGYFAGFLQTTYVALIGDAGRLTAYYTGPGSMSFSQYTTPWYSGTTMIDQLRTTGAVFEMDVPQAYVLQLDGHLATGIGGIGWPIYDHTEGYGGLSVTFTPPPSESFESIIPEPSTLAIWSLLGLCGIGFGWRRRRKA